MEDLAKKELESALEGGCWPAASCLLDQYQTAEVCSLLRGSQTTTHPPMLGSTRKSCVLCQPLVLEACSSSCAELFERRFDANKHEMGEGLGLHCGAWAGLELVLTLRLVGVTVQSRLVACLLVAHFAAATS